jgi:preprotein translocase subunit YajC
VATTLTEILWSMQPEATETVTEQPSQPSGGGGREQPLGCDPTQQTFVMLILMFGIIYFLMIRPQQKRQKETDAMLKSLRAGDMVRTSGGIRGEIVDLDDTEVTLLIADKVKVNILRTHVAGKQEKKSAIDKGKV